MKFYICTDVTHTHRQTDRHRHTQTHTHKMVKYSWSTLGLLTTTLNLSKQPNVLQPTSSSPRKVGQNLLPNMLECHSVIGPLPVVHFL